MHMADWEEKLNAFLKFTGREVLDNYGTISAEIAKIQFKIQQYQTDAVKSVGNIFVGQHFTERDGYVRDCSS